MADNIKILEAKIKDLEGARDQLSSGWLQTEREKLRIVASINNLLLGYAMCDDVLNIIYKNPILEKLLGKSVEGDWTVNEFHKRLSGFDLVGSCQQVLKSKQGFVGRNIPYEGKNINIYLSPILILKDSLTCFGATIIIEESMSASSDSESLGDQLIAIYGSRIQREILNLIALSKKATNTEISTDDALLLVSQNEKYLDILLKDIRDLVGGSEQLIKMVVKKEVFDLSELVQNGMKKFAVIADEKSLKIEFENLEQGFLKAHADPSVVTAVLDNYLQNAIQYTDKGVIKVSIEEKKGFLKVSVSDSGCGIAEENVQLLFKKTPKIDSKYGVGLYHSKLLTEIMGGEAYLEYTELGKGSSFAFTVPVATGINSAEVAPLA